MPDTKHLLNRIAFGPRPGDVQRIQQLGADKYLEQQLHPDRIEDQAAEELLAGFPSIKNVLMTQTTRRSLQPL